MTESTLLTPQPDHPFHTWGFYAVALGAVALVLAMLHIFGPMSQPQPPVGQQIGEIAGDIARSAWLSFRDLPQPESEPIPLTLFDKFGLVAPFVGIAAVILALISGLRRENWHYAAYGVALGGSAIVFQFIWWLTLVIMGVMLLVAIIENIGDILG